MACAVSEQSSAKPVTRKQTDVWLVGQMSSTLSGTKLPSKREVLALFVSLPESCPKNCT